MMKVETKDINITSPQNPKIKWARGLHKHSTRREEGVIITEGAKEIDAAVASGLYLKTLFVAPNIFEDKNELPPAEQVFTITNECFERLAYRSATDGLIGIFEEPRRTLGGLHLGRNPLILVLESVEKPGNLGAIVRTADGAGVDAVVVCDERTDIWNPNAIRASVGTIFSTQIAVAGSQEVYDYLQSLGASIYTAELTESAIPYIDADFTTPSALLLGTEHEGVSDFWLERTQHVVIPMQGRNNSLNVSVAAGVLVYEALRQRSQA